MPEPQEVGPPDINDLLQPRFATSFENRVGADADTDGSKADRVRAGSHRSHRQSIGSEKEPPRNVSAISLRRADFWNATGLGRWAMGDACHSGVDPRSSPLGAGAGMPPCGDPESSLFRPHLDRVLGDIPDGPSADWRRCPRL